MSPKTEPKKMIKTVQVPAVMQEMNCLKDFPVEFGRFVDEFFFSAALSLKLKLQTEKLAIQAFTAAQVDVDQLGGLLMAKNDLETFQRVPGWKNIGNLLTEVRNLTRELKCKPPHMPKIPFLTNII